MGAVKALWFEGVAVTKTVSLTTHLQIDPDTMWGWVTKPALLDYVAAPLIKFRMHEPLPHFTENPEELLDLSRLRPNA